MMATERKLSNAIRDVKNAIADRDDVVVELREAQRTRLELLAMELEPVFADIPPDALQFDLVISQGLQPRLWIDMSAHVGMGRDRRTYRFVRDVRQGRSVLAETPDIRKVADQVTRYIAERMIEHRRLIEGTPMPVMQDRLAEDDQKARRPQVRVVPAAPVAEMAAPAAPVEAVAPQDAPQHGWNQVLTGLLLVLGGAVMALILLGIVFWGHLPGIQLVR